MNKSLTLYHLSYCPYCHKVIRAAEALGIELKYVDIAAQPAARRYLLAKLGRSTVPVLGIHGPDGERLLPESNDIITYLYANGPTSERVA